MCKPCILHGTNGERITVADQRDFVVIAVRFFFVLFFATRECRKITTLEYIYFFFIIIIYFLFFWGGIKQIMNAACVSLR